MRMISGSHLTVKLDHYTIKNDDNLLSVGQAVGGVYESFSVHCPLKSGQTSFHNGWTLHASKADKSDGRRIVLNVQYLASH